MISPAWNIFIWVFISRKQVEIETVLWQLVLIPVHVPHFAMQRPDKRWNMPVNIIETDIFSFAFKGEVTDPTTQGICIRKPAMIPNRNSGSQLYFKGPVGISPNAEGRYLALKITNDLSALPRRFH